MANEFYHEEIQPTPAGFHVRTITHPSGHEVRLAFPPGRRKRGSGRLIEILHPHAKTNPCVAARNPATADSWNRASEAGRVIALKVAAVPEISVYVHREWKDLPKNIRAMIAGKPMKNGGRKSDVGSRKNTFDTAREKAAFAAGVDTGSKKLGSALSTLRTKRATRLERTMKSGLGKNPQSKNKLLAQLTSAEDAFYGKMFGDYMGNQAGATPLRADAYAWKRLKEEFPRLREFKVAKPNPKRNLDWAKAVADNMLENYRQRIAAYAETPAVAKEKVLSETNAGPAAKKLFIAALGKKQKAKTKSKIENRKSKKNVGEAGLHSGGFFVDDGYGGRTTGPFATRALAQQFIRELNAKFIEKGQKAWPMKVVTTPHDVQNPTRNLDEIKQAQKLYEEFSGKPSGTVTMINEPVKARDDYAHLGWVEWVAFHLAYDDEGYDPAALSKAYHELMEDGEGVDDAWKTIADEFSIKLRVFDFNGDEIRLAASPEGNQLYFLGGKQPDFAEHLGSFHTDTTRDRVLLGEVVGLSYEAKKEQLGDKKPQSYYHVFAEEGGEPPVAYWDALNKRIMLVGGNYSLDNAKVGIVN